MVEFGTKTASYSHPMDRNYDHHDAVHDHGFPASGGQATGDVGVSIGDLGMSLGLGPVPNVQAVGAKLRPGTKKLEFVFTGMGKGQGQAQTPGMYGKKQREALVEMGKANRIDFTTHSTVGVYGLAGMDQQGNFSKASKNYSLQEVKRAIDFAADVAFGGPVVVHTGEFTRPLVDAEWNMQDDPWKEKFQMFEDEKGRTSYKVVDTRTGGLITEARKNRYVSRPEWNIAEPGQEYFDKDGQAKIAKEGERIYIDYFGKKLDPENRVPQFDSKTQEFKIKQMKWDDLEEEAKEMTERARQEWKQWKRGEISDQKFKDSRWGRFAEARNIDDVQVRPEEAYVLATYETNASNSKGWALRYGGDFEDMISSVKKLKDAKKFYAQLKETTDSNEQWKLKEKIAPLAGGLVPRDSLFPEEIIDREIRNFEHQINQAKEAASSQWAQAKETEEAMKHIESADTYALREANDAYARLAIVAMQQSEKLEMHGKLKKPLAVAMENLFPEQYGAHPDEMITLVKGSRKRMIQLLVEQGLSEDLAKTKAQQHITATFDTGHLNMWRKYWKGKPEEFDQWSVQKLGEMVDANIIGHVHIDDNYGYHDEHLAPGEGNTPIREMVKLLKQKGYKGEMIIEPGADYTTDVTGFHSVMKTWREFGIPVYGKGTGLSSKESWQQVGYGWFGQNQPPYFTFGGYSPSEDWTLWSGVPFE
ncbi:MAG: TIM barrel protein [Nanoarchaeota archaeon]|nr:TIM barrel protein [Nanoarchaeota archaeon]